MASIARLGTTATYLTPNGGKENIYTNSSSDEVVGNVRVSMYLAYVSGSNYTYANCKVYLQASGESAFEGMVGQYMLKVTDDFGSTVAIDCFEIRGLLVPPNYTVKAEVNYINESETAGSVLTYVTMYGYSEEDLLITK